VLVKSITWYTPPAYPCPSPIVTLREPFGQAGVPTTAGELEDVEVTGTGVLATGVLVMGDEAAGDELAGVDGEDEDDAQPVTTRAAKQASAAAAHLVRELTGLVNTAVPPCDRGPHAPLTL
jgi:hypothetical protein